jgi:integrase
MRAQSSPRPKRANGEGSIYQIKRGRSAGHWRCAVALPNGHRRTFYGKTREEVEAKLLDARHALAHNQPVEPPHSLSVATFLRDWIVDQRPYLRPRTWAGYKGNVDNHIIKSIGTLKLAELQPADVRRLHRECAARGLSKRTVEYVHTILHKALDQAVHDQLVPRNVAHKTRPPSSQRPKVAPYTPDEAIRFLEEVRGEPEEPLYVVTLGLGLRRGEALGLRWSDINWTARTVTIAGQLQRVKGDGLVWVAPKTDDSIAVLDAPEFVLDAMMAHRDRQQSLTNTTGYVFTGARGQPLDPDAVSHGFVRFCERHGLRRTRFHDLRHATASLLLARGIPLWQVSKILRHSSIAITTDTYGHLYSVTSRAAADEMSSFMAQAR